jgi:hypothetical protein
MYHRDYGVRAQAALLRAEYENDAAQPDTGTPEVTVPKRPAGDSLVTRLGTALARRRAPGACHASGGCSR